MVTDESNAAVPGAKIAATNLATGVAVNTVTNESGLYSVPFLIPGTYRVEASKEGFAVAKRENLVLNVSRTVAVDFRLRSRASGGQLGFQAQAVTPSTDAVAEFKVVANNNSAEYGFRMGATVIVQTKSGSNEFHGSLYEFLRNERLDGTNFFAVGRGKPPCRQDPFGTMPGTRCQ